MNIAVLLVSFPRLPIIGGRSYAGVLTQLIAPPKVFVGCGSGAQGLKLAGLKHPYSELIGIARWGRQNGRAFRRGF
jgi:hypothetical protein